MNLRQSFFHNVIIHPLLFVADVLDWLGVAQGIGVALDFLHDVTGLEERATPGPEASGAEVWMGDEAGEEAEDEEDEEDEGEGWPTPAQDPRTAASKALEYRPPAPTAPPPAPPPLAGSREARVRAARGPG